MDVGLSRIEQIGWMSMDPEMKFDSKGKPYCMVWLCPENPRGSAMFFPWHVYGSRGEYIAENFHKGDRIYIEGNPIMMQKYEDGRRIEHFFAIATKVVFLTQKQG